MNRKNFLKGLGLVGAGISLPKSNLLAPSGGPEACVLIPSETAGPFPLDLTANNAFFRTNIKESKTGVPLGVKIRVLGLSNCLAMQNVRVNIWHCDKDGLYSGYDVNNNAGQAGLTYCRGFQISNSNGEVNFNTIFPGWYNGRICHIHFQVFVSSSYSAISQMTFDLPTKNSIYINNPSLYPKGADPLTYASDNIFSDGYIYQLATLTPNPITNGYDAFIEVSVNGAGTTGVGNIEKENAKQFSLGQNFPNPYSTQTTIPFTLRRASNVNIEIWNLMGEKIETLLSQKLNQGTHKIIFNPSSLNLSAANYIYQLEVENSDGIFREAKMMTCNH